MDAGAIVQGILEWVGQHGLDIVLWAVISFLAYRYARSAIHRLLVGIMRGHEVTMGVDPELAEEYAKRSATLEDLLTRLVQAGVAGLFVLILLGAFAVWPVLAGAGLVVAAITLAGQSIVLDYLMGVLILVEGQYFKGDVVRIGTVDGEVEEVGLRRTVLRDATGTVHSVSNGEIRVSSNLTRVYAILRVDVSVVRGDDVDRAIDIIDRVGREMKEDPVWTDRLLQPPTYQMVTALTEAGATLRVTARVRPADRWAAPGELRRRLAVALAQANIETVRWPIGAGSGRTEPGT